MEQQHDLAKWLAGEMTETELARFRQTREYKTYERIAGYSAQLQPSELDENAMLAGVLAHRKAAKVIPFYRTAAFRVAAMLVIGLGVFFLLRPANAVVTEMAANGKTAQTSLPDASQVTLNSGSRIEYDKAGWNDNRSLSLQGEAFFKVAKGKKFDVKTPLGTVTVVGTQFNVKARGKRLEVDCFEGMVRVATQNTELLLQKGQFAVFEDGKQIWLGTSSEQAPSWTKNEMRFRSVDLSQAVDEIERVYNVDIEIRKAPAGRMTGSLPSNDLGKAISILCTTYSLHAQTIDKKVVLSANE